ncbi:MAG TPA: phosphoribosyltransferase family protein [Patescibacteria group bacterium]|nr:phosphoribosyltransferase family protein [Patescibacteria group bacterium]
MFPISQRVRDLPIEVVVGPAYGAMIAAHLVASCLNGFGSCYPVAAVFAVKSGAGFEIRPSMRKYVSGKWALVIEDVLTTGGSVKRTIEATIRAGASIIGVGAICNRGSIQPEDLGLPQGALRSLVDLSGLRAYTPAECPMCQAGIPISLELGHGS